jgi:hypothetical protein
MVKSPDQMVVGNGRIDRRKLLTSLGTTGSIASAGCVGDKKRSTAQSDTGTAKPPQKAPPTPQTAFGDAVYYDPSGNGPYDDGQAALDDVPPGGTFIIGTGAWNVAQEGRLVIEKSMNIRGQGVPGKFESGGTRILNTGEDAIDKPPVEFKGAKDLDKTNPRINGGIRELAIEHEGNAPALRFLRAIRNHVLDCHIDCRQEAPKGIVYDHWAFFARCARTRVRNATDVCVHVTRSGYAHEFRANHIGTNVDNAIAFLTETSRPIIIGGECVSTGKNGIGIRFQDDVQGGLILEPGVEHTPIGVDLGGNTDQRDSGLVEDVQIYHLGLTSNKEVGVRFGNAKGCRLIRPVTYGTSGKDSYLAEFQERSIDCGIESPAWALLNENIKDTGGTNPFVKVTSNVSDTMLAGLPTAVPTKVDHYAPTGTPAWYDGENWYRTSKHQFTPGQNQ